MAETLVENRICEACGAEVRPTALFCYNCGEDVAPDFVAPQKNDLQKNEVSDAWFEDDPTGKPDKTTTRLDKVKIEERPDEEIMEIGAEKEDETVKEEAEKKADKQEEGKLKSAANLRRQTKQFQKKKVEVVWEEPQNKSNAWFVLTTLLLMLLVVLVYYLAMYVK